MKRMELAVGMVLLAALGGPLDRPASAQTRTCKEAGSSQAVVQGRLGLLQGLGPAAFIVSVPGGLCLAGADQSDNITQALTVQLYANTPEGYEELYTMVGEKVYVRGKLSGQRTFQQKAPILMEVLEIAAE